MARVTVVDVTKEPSDNGIIVYGKTLYEKICESSVGRVSSETELISNESKGEINNGNF